MKKIQILVLLFFSFHGIAQKKALQTRVNKKVSSWLPSFDFNPANFRTPSLSFGPLARWWWPGNFVTKDELKREINLFADNGFAGVEVQPMNLAIPTANEDERKRVTSWDTPEYYENLKVVMEEARKRNLIVDMTNGSGWPPAAPNLRPEDGFLSLELSDTTVVGGKSLSFALPQLAAGKNRAGVPPVLQAIIIARPAPTTPGDKGAVHLDAASSKVITSVEHNGTLSYPFPEGTWQVIAFWAVRNGEQNSLAAAAKPLIVVDHFDSLKVLKL
jgi:hypothetical protein